MKNLMLCALIVCVVGCAPQPGSNPVDDASINSKEPVKAVKIDEVPAFTLAWSEYPSWSVFGVASENGLINGEQGKQGPIEKKWGVDIVLKEADYDTCLTLFGTKTVDAACLTNIDTLAPSTGRASVAVLPTSTSVGGDACIVTGDHDLNWLLENPTYGLEKSVSQYAFERNLILQGKNPKDYTFKNMDPSAAAQAVQTNQNNINSIMVWNPFVLQTLRTRQGTKVLFDSSTIPEEIIDCVMVGKDTLSTPKGEDFACAVIETYYALNQQLADPATADKTLVAIGAKFSSLGLDDMKLVVTQTKFYSTPEAALKLFNSSKFQKQTMPGVVEFCETHEIVEKSDGKRVGFNDDSVPLNFTTKYIEKVLK